MLKKVSLALLVCLGLVATASAELFSTIDYYDSFTTNDTTRVAGSAPTGDGLLVEQNHTANTLVQWTKAGDVDMLTLQNSTTLSGVSMTGNAGAVTGFMRSEKGSGSESLTDYSVAYGLHTDYTVSIDAVLPTTDRVNISSLAHVGDSIITDNALSVFFRAGDSSSGHGGIDLYAPSSINGADEYKVISKGTIGFSDRNWHNLAVRFDQPNNQLWLYVDGTLVGKDGAKEPINLVAAFGEGFTFSNAAVSTGSARAYPGNSGDTSFGYIDNFTVGASAVPEPSAMAMVLCGLIGLVLVHRKRA